MTKIYYEPKADKIARAVFEIMNAAKSMDNETHEEFRYLLVKYGYIDLDGVWCGRTETSS